MKHKLLFISLLILVFSSCEKLMFEKDGKSSDPYDNFEHLWQECNEKYAFFEYKGINWEATKAEYQPKLSDGMSEDSLFTILAAMLDELRDDHVNLVSDFNRSFYGNYRRGQDNFDWRIVADNYLPENYYVSGPFTHDFIAGDSVGYIRLSSFPGSIDEENLDFVLNRYKNTDGLIIDIRENGGGSIADIYDLLSRFVSQKTLLYYTRLKNGPGKDDFTPLEPVFIEPEGEVSYQKTVCLLTDRGSYSASSFTALGARAVDNFVIIGDTTGGGLGLPNGGQLPNGWTYRFSVTQTLDENGNNFESGVPPHIPAFINWDDRQTDEVIERAVQEIMASS